MLSSDSLSTYFSDRSAEFITADVKQEFLQDLAEKFGYSHVTYFGVFSDGSGGSTRQLITTYPKDWEQHYFQNRYDDLDPVIQMAMNRVLPFNWEQITKEDTAVRTFFGEAAEFGICSHGISIPVRGPNGDHALFSVNSNRDAKEWLCTKVHKLSDLTYCAHLIHSAVKSSFSVVGGESQVSLSRREQDVLRWAARGKTCWETGQILGLTERTVDFYIKNACAKLGASTKTQAVSLAISNRHLVVPQLWS